MFRVPPDGGPWGIILAAVYPRGRSVFDRLLPRPLLPVAQTPVITYALRWLAEAGVQSVTVCANGAARGVRIALEGTAGVPQRVTFHEDWRPRGTAGGVRDAGLGTRAGTFVVVDATTIPLVDLRGMLETHTASGAALTVAVHRDPVPGASGPGLSPSGAYVFDRRVLEHIGRDGFQDIKEALIPRLHAAGEHVEAHLSDGVCPRVFDAESYLAVNEWMITRSVRDRRPLEGYELRDGALVHHSARVSARARLVGPVVLGPGVRVGDEATVVGATVLGDGCRVERGAVVSRSVLWSNCRLDEDSLVDRCLVSHDAVVPARLRLYRTLEAGPLAGRAPLSEALSGSPSRSTPRDKRRLPVARPGEAAQAI